MVDITLVRPGTDEEYDVPSGYTIIPPPSGLEILASYFKSRIRNVQVKIHADIKNLEGVSVGDFIGISDWFSNHQTAMGIAKKAKQNNPNCKVIIGGPNASNLGERILNNHPYVDYVVWGDGEEAFAGIIETETGERGISTIPNLLYRAERQNHKFTFKKNVNLNENPLFDFSHLINSDILEPYDSRRENFIKDENRTPVSLSSIRGCLKAVNLGKCTYCNIPTEGFRITDPKNVWAQIRILYDRYGIKEFFETGDDFVIGDYPQRLLDAKPKGLDVSFRIYTAPDKVSPKVANLLRQLGVREIFMGIENINPKILRRANKFYDTSKVEDSVRNCEKESIYVFLPFLFGLPGETEETARKNQEFAHNLVDKYSNIKRILYTLAVPVIGCSWFEELKSDKEILKQYPEILWQDNLKYPLLTKLSIEQLCKVNLDTLLQIVDSPPILLSQRAPASYGDIARKLSSAQ